MKASVVKMVNNLPSFDPKDSFVTNHYKRPAMLFEFGIKDKINKDDIYKVDILKDDGKTLISTHFLLNGTKYSNYPK